MVTQRSSFQGVQLTHCLLKILLKPQLREGSKALILPGVLGARDLDAMVFSVVGCGQLGCGLRIVHSNSPA